MALSLDYHKSHLSYKTLLHHGKENIYPFSVVWFMIFFFPKIDALDF